MLIRSTLTLLSVIERLTTTLLAPFGTPFRTGFFAIGPFCEWPKLINRQ
jgi:hypothetical protein